MRHDSDRRFALSLRSRLVAALAVTSALTLGIAAITLLSPLEKRLRDEQLNSLTAAAIAEKPELQNLAPTALRPRSPIASRALARVRRHTGAELALVGSSGVAVAVTDVDTGQRFPDAAVAIRLQRTVRKVVSADGADEGRVAVPLTIRDRHYALVLEKSLDEARTAAQTVRQAFIVAALLGFAIALTLGVGIASRIAKRLRALRETALRVAELGPTVEMEADGARDEVGDLTRAFAMMQHRLREQEAARRTFVATASHELRTPLTSLGMLLDLLEEDLACDPIDATHARDQAARAHTQAQRLSRLAAELLDLSRIDAGVPLRSEPIELRELCRAVAAEFEPRTGAGAPQLDVSGEDECWALGDPGAVARIVRILVDNALRFSPSDGAIRVMVSDPSGEPSIRVQDDGPGIPAAEREAVFERFRRGSDGGGEGGFGLGLAIGRELAQRMGGDLRLEPQEAGTTFALRLNVAPTE